MIILKPFKSYGLFISLLGAFNSLFSQGLDSAYRQKIMIELEKRSARLALNINLSIKPAAKQSIKSPTSFKFNNQPLKVISANNCNDSSFKKLFEAADRDYSFFCSVKTNDGGIVIGGYGRNKLEGPPYKWYATITKFDSIGNHIWSKELRSDIYYGMYIESIKELNDGSIIATGWHDNTIYPTEDSSDFFVVKLSSIGNIIWLRTFHSTLNNNCSTHNIRFVSIAEGANGDLLIAGTGWNCPLPKYLEAISKVK